MFAERYNRLHKISQAAVESLLPNGVEALIPFIYSGGGSLDLGLDKVAALLPKTASTHERDHLVTIHLAAIESHLYRHGYCTTGHMIRTLSGNYAVAMEEEKQSMLNNGFPSLVSTVGSAQELDDLTPLKRVADAEYTDLYARLEKAWGDERNQKDIAKEMTIRLARILDLLPIHKIGDDFFRERKGRNDPLPLYVRNEIHHPSVEGLRDSLAFQRDKSIAYAIMETWLSEK
ncbi:MAG: hypothetical protein OXP66_00780 [Candidatus Tectomicrobia bacterium]|nr:hypothetical protein [Candidatus Tectomicrobia bacterium]